MTIKQLIERCAEHNKTILNEVANVRRLLITIERDASEGFVPRYTTHLQQHVDNMVAAQHKIDELNQISSMATT